MVIGLLTGAVVILLLLIFVLALVLGEHQNRLDAHERRLNANALGLETLANKVTGPTLGEMTTQDIVDRMGRKVMARHAATRQN